MKDWSAQKYAVWEMRERWVGGFQKPPWSWFGRKWETGTISVIITDYFWKRQTPIPLTFTGVSFSNILLWQNGLP